MQKLRHFLLTLALLGCSGVLFAQTLTVKGKVSASAGNTPLPGVTIVEKGTTNGTISDADGNYSLTVATQYATLTLSYLGYQSREVAVNGAAELNVQLDEDGAKLDEVVVVGYGTQKRANVTGAISSIKATDIENLPIVRIEQALQGQVSGVRVVQSSGQPGTGATVRIRGTSSINNSDPLYVVDNVPINGGIEYLNQGDIESIEVLKDAASAAIYGARAANGVILVTTKKGGFTDHFQVSYSTYLGTQAPWKRLSLLNATEYATLMNEASVASGGALLFPDPKSLGSGTDWQSAVFNNNAPIRNHELSITAGTKRSQYFASFGYYNQIGTVASDRSQFERFSARFNSTHKLTKGITFGNTIGYTHITSKGVSENSEYGSPLTRAVNLDPLTPITITDTSVSNHGIYKNFPVVRDGNGNPYGISKYVTSEIINPVAALAVQHGQGASDKIVANVFAEVEFIKGLKFRSSIGADLAFWGDEYFTPVYYLNASNTSDYTHYGRSANRGLFWIQDNSLSYSRAIGKHEFTALVANVVEDNEGQLQGGSIQKIPVTRIEDASLSFPVALADRSFYGSEYKNTLLSYLARINYSYDQRFLLTLIGRQDGSSRFGSNNKFGFFPSASAGWVASEERFVKKMKVIDFLKLRTSWGVNGNDQIGDFRYVSTVNGGRNYTFGTGGILTNGVSPNALANPDLKWEQTKQLDFGFDARLFKHLSLTADYFEKTTDGMLLDIAVPGYVGNAGPVGNIASMRNWGWEVELAYDRKIRDVKLRLSGNVTHLLNEVTSLGVDKDYLTGQTFSPQGLEITRTVTGQPIGSFWGYKTDGIFQNQAEVNAYKAKDGTPIQPGAKPGDFRFKDLDGDGKITAADRTIIGDPTPRWTYGITLNAAWRGFDLLIFTQGVSGNQVFKATRRFDLQMANLTSDALGRWTGEGSTNAYPRLTLTDPNGNFSRSSDFYVEDGSYFRIKTLQIGYTIPKTLTERVGIKHLRVYASANNLFTITKYSGFDPEIGGSSYGVDRGNYPQARSFMGGLNVTF